MRFGSVCSGIEAASAAWEPLGWKAAWLAEIEKFPSAVLAHHYPDVPNLGDMTVLPERIRSGEVMAPDVLCGGTPCQAFSVAGLRKSLGDARGNLSLIFCEIANEIDAVRSIRGEQPAIIFWENVPGVLSTSDNAFGCFIGALSGMSKPLDAPDWGWTSAGCVSGPQRTVAWRVLDAQYFGVAQRRKRVFVVASARKWFDPAAVLFEFDGVRRDFAPSREAGKVAPTIPARSLGGGGLGTDFDCDGGVIASTGNISHCLNAGGMGRQDYETETLVTHILRGNGFNASEDGTERGTPMTFQEISDCLTSAYGTKWNGNASATNGSLFVAQPIAFHPTQAPISSNDGSTHALGCGSSGGQATVAVTYALQHAQIGRKDSAGPQGKGWQEEVAFTQDSRSCADAVAVAVQPYTLAIRGRGDGHNLEYRQDGTANALLTPNGGRGGIGVGAVAAPMAFVQNSRDEVRLMGGDGSLVGALAAETGAKQQCYVAQPIVGALACNTGPNGHDAGNFACNQAVDAGHVIPQAMQVRRLTPVECERLQGFPDNYTAIPWRNKPASECPDGPRYKAPGNSWAIPCVAWIGKRIQKELSK